MTPEQFQELITVLKLLTTKSYTITGAADWPILLVLGTALVGVIAFMWRDLRGVIQDNKTDSQKEIDKLWKAMHDCQKECCPPRRKE